MFKSLVTGFAAAALLSGAAAFAQAPQPGAMKDRAAWRAQRQADRLAQLKTQLKITSAQEPSWNAFASAWQAMHLQWRGKAAKSRTSGLTPAPEVFDRLAEYAGKRAENARALAEAAKKLYGELTPVQRAVFDTHLADRRGLMKHRYPQRMNRQAPRNGPPPPSRERGMSRA